MLLERVKKLDDYLQEHVMAGMDKLSFNAILAAGVAETSGELLLPEVQELKLTLFDAPAQILWIAFVIFRAGEEEEQVTVLYAPARNEGQVCRQEQLTEVFGEKFAESVNLLFDMWRQGGRLAGQTPGPTSRQ